MMDKEQLQKISLLDCAHCGGKAGTKDLGRHTIGMGESSREILIGCQNKGCMVQINAGGRDDVEMFQAVLKAVSAWNTRMA